MSQPSSDSDKPSSLEVEAQATSSSTSTVKPPPHIYDTIAEPVKLRTLLHDDIYVLGGQFAILCQFAHPGLAKGSYNHSSFASRIAQRLKNTARFLNAAVYGTREEKNAIFSVIHGYHGHVKGDGYDANDPELHKWTAATLFVALVVVQETFFEKFSQEMMEELYKEAAVYGTSLRMPPEMWPATLEDFWAYWDHNIATLEVTDEARKLCQDLMYPANLPFGLRAMTPMARLLTTHWLPERLAKEYGLQPTMLSKLQYQALVSTMRVTYPLLPQNMRQFRHNHYMEDLKQAVERIEKTGHWVRESKL